MAAGEIVYRRSIREAVRGLWSGAIDENQAFDAMASAAERRLRQAWHDGAAECGIMPEDLTPEEKNELANAINKERGHIQGMLNRIVARADGGLLREAFAASKFDLWVNRFQELKNNAQMMACGDRKLEWGMNPQKENCFSCRKLDGQVRRASFWRERDLRPYSHQLE